MFSSLGSHLNYVLLAAYPVPWVFKMIYMLLAPCSLLQVRGSHTWLADINKSSERNCPGPPCSFEAGPEQPCKRHASDCYFKLKQGSRQPVLSGSASHN